MADYSIHQDVFGQLPRLKTYTHMLLGFPVADDASRDIIVPELERACRELVEILPWLGGHVVNEGAGPGSSGLVRAVPYSTGERTTLVTAKDCTGSLPSFEEITAAGGPMSMLDGAILSPAKTQPGRYNESDELAPVFAVQANFIQGGLLLDIGANHHIMDMNGLGKLTELLAKKLRGEQPSEMEIEQGNRDRRNIIRLLGPDERKTDVSVFFQSHATTASLPNAKGQDDANLSALKWVYFNFPLAGLTRLKAFASQGASPSSWVSTNDALSAFVCQRITVARIKRRGRPEKGTFTIGRAFNARSYLEPPLPSEYLGHAVYVAKTTVALDSPSATSDLPGLAERFRSALKGMTSNEIHSFVTAVAAEQDKTHISIGNGMDLQGFDLLLSSWSGLPVYQTDFGAVLGGKPRLAKRQRFAPAESIVYFMPKTNAGDVDVAVCLRSDDIEALKSDDILMEFASYVG